MFGVPVDRIRPRRHVEFCIRRPPAAARKNLAASVSGVQVVLRIECQRLSAAKVEESSAGPRGVAGTIVIVTGWSRSNSRYSPVDGSVVPRQWIASACGISTGTAREI